MPDAPYRAVCLRLWGDVAEGSPNRRLHWRTRHAIDQKWKLLAFHAWCELAAPLFFRRKVRVSFHVHRGRAIDADNLAGSRCIKGAIDGLKGRLFADDSPGFLEWGEVTQTTGRDYAAEPYVDVLVQEIAGDFEKEPA